MSYHAEAYEDYDRPWYQKKSLWIIAAVILCLLAVGIGIFTYVGLSKIPDVGGGLTIEADPDTRIYIADKLVGTTNVTFTWAELFGDDKHQALALELPDLSAKVTPDLISEAGAKALDSQGLGRSSMTTLAVSGDKFMIQRTDGTLDEVFTHVIDWAPPNQAPRRFLVPIRVRKGGGSTAYFNEIGAGYSGSGGAPGFVKAFGKPPTEIKIHWKFSAGTPPAQFAEKIKMKGLWEPRGEK